MPNTVQVQVRIERKTKYGDYHDAIYFAADEFFNADGSRKISDEQIEAVAQQRVTNHERNIEEARLRPPPPEPTDDELFGGMPPEYVEKFAKWIEKKNKPDIPVDTVPGPRSPDPVTPKQDMKVKP